MACLKKVQVDTGPKELFLVVVLTFQIDIFYRNSINEIKLPVNEREETGFVPGFTAS